MFCIKCGSELTEEDAFCNKCGTKRFSEENSNNSYADAQQTVDTTKRSRKKTYIIICVIAIFLVAILIAQCANSPNNTNTLDISGTYIPSNYDANRYNSQNTTLVVFGNSLTLSIDETFTFGRTTKSGIKKGTYTDAVKHGEGNNIYWFFYVVWDNGVEEKGYYGRILTTNGHENVLMVDGTEWVRISVR